MQFWISFMTLGLAMANAVADTSLDSSHEISNGIQFTGQIEVGGPNVTLSGTAKSIYEQILKLNPDYDPMDFQEYRDRHESSLAVARSVEKRDWTNCNIGGTGDNISQPGMACLEGVNYLNRLNGWCGTGAYSCNRVSCSQTCGIFVCNDNNYGISIWCGNIGGDALEIMRTCTRSVGTSGLVSYVQGQVYRGDFWSTLMKRQNC